MEKNKNEIFFTYIDSLDNPDLLNNYQFKKPSLNQYAENYLANLDNLKSLNDFKRNNSIKNFKDNNSSVKALSNDKTNNDSIINTNILSNSISKINGIFNSNRNEESIAKNKLKTKDNLVIEHLKKNFQMETNSPDNISKIDDINKTKKDNIYCFSYVNQNKSKNILQDFYKKISPSQSQKFNSPLFSALKSSDSNYSSFKVLIKDYKMKNKLNFSKRLNSYNDIRNNKNKRFLLKKRIKDRNIRVQKTQKEFSKSFLYKNLLTNYISSDRDKFRKKINYNKKNSIRLQMSKFSEIRNMDDSISQIHSYTQRYKQNKSYSQSMEDYWKEKELKKQIKIERIRKEKILKEKREMTDRPKINENSRKIVERITNNSCINVFDRLSGLKKSQLIYNEKISNLRNENSLSRITLNTEKSFKNYINRSKIEIRNDNYFSSFKQIEDNNKKLIKKFNNIKERKNDIEKKHNLNKIKKFINTNINRRNSFINKKENIKFLKKGLKLCNITESEITKIYDKHNKIKPNICKPKIMYKKIKLKNNLIEKEIQNRDNNLEKSKPINKDIIYKIDNSIQINRNNENFLNYNNKENIYSTLTFGNKNQILYPVNINQIKKDNNIRINNRASYIKKSKNIKEENINILSNRNENKNNMFKKYHCSVYNKRNENKTELNNFKSIIISGNEDNNQYFKNVNNNNLKNGKLSKTIMDSISHFENESLIGNKLFNSFIFNSDSHKFNENNNGNNNTINSNLIDTKKYFKIPLKSELKKQKNLRARTKTDYSTYNNNNNFIINDNNILLSEQATNNNEVSSKVNYQVNNGMNNKIDNYKFIKKNIENNDIERRRLELLKLLNFSSKIGIDQ